MLCLSLMLVGLSLYHRLQGATPEIIPIIMLLASLILTVGCIMALQQSKPLYQIRVVMLDGSSVTISRKQRLKAELLLKGLTDAMDWHRSVTIEIDAQSASRVREAREQASEQRPQGATAKRRRFIGRGNGLRQAFMRVFRWLWRRCSLGRPDVVSEVGVDANTQTDEERQASSEPSGQADHDKKREPSDGGQRQRYENIIKTQARQNAFADSGPVINVKEITLTKRVKMLFTRLRGRLFGKSTS